MHRLLAVLLVWDFNLFGANKTENKLIILVSEESCLYYDTIKKTVTREKIASSVSLCVRTSSALHGEQWVFSL